MAKVPVITSPCPLRFSSMPQSGLDFCGKCERRVHNLDGMDFAQRRSFFANCSGQVCVAYTVRKPGLLSGALSLSLVAAAALTAGPATAQDPATVDESYPTVVTGPTCDTANASHPETVMLAGGVEPSAPMDWIDESELALPDRPDLPEIETSEWLPTPNASGSVR